MAEEDVVFSVEVDLSGPGPLVRVRGDLDLESAPALTDRLKALVGQHLLVVDLTGVEFLDSTGLGVLVGAHTDSAACGGGLALVGLHPRVQKVLRITKLNKVFTTYDTLEALNADLAGS